MAMFFQDIERFLALADCLSYTAAAARLFITQPALSGTIASLERELGCKLFHRSTRSVELTAEGKELYFLSKEYIEKCKLLNSPAKKTPIVSGKCSIFYDRTVDAPHLPFLFAAFKQKNPAINVSVHHKNIDSVFYALENGSADIGLCSSFSIHHDIYQSRLLVPYSLQILVWKEHPLCGRESISLRDLVSEPFIIMNPSTSNGTKLILSMCTVAGVNIKESIHVENFRQMFMLTAQREGISFNLTNEDTALEYWGLRCIDVDLSDCFPHTKEVGLSAVWLPENPNPAIRLFLTSMTMLQTLVPTTIKISDS